jgi:hypothetical protein
MTVSTLTAKDAEALLRKMYYKDNYSVDVDDYDYEDEHWGELGWSLKSVYVWNSDKGVREDKVPGETVDGIHVTCVEDFGGGEGSGETRFVVFSFADATGTKYFRKDGFYASYDGTTWDGDFREVTPQERTVTFYE